MLIFTLKMLTDTDTAGAITTPALATVMSVSKPVATFREEISDVMR